ncbi:MAG: hypothetical protein LBT09_01925 [Planctomycetaceae bacterium]|nr:hypothetical protein [Planctomycetaceae bacterium]
MKTTTKKNTTQKDRRRPARIMIIRETSRLEENLFFSTTKVHEVTRKGLVMILEILRLEENFFVVFREISWLEELLEALYMKPPVSKHELSILTTKITLVNYSVS